MSRLRIPEWTDRTQVTCRVNGQARSVSWSSNYIRVCGLRAGDTVAVEFPMVERTLFRLIGGIPYRLTIRGNTVVAMESTITDTESELTFTGEARLRDGGGHPDALRQKPFGPLYQREQCRRGEPSMKEATRSVSGEVVQW